MNSDKLNNKKTNTEEAIMEASEALFLEKGYLLATTTEIARRAGVTHAMLHYYYRTKEQIFFKVLDKNLHELFQSVRAGMSSEEVSFWENLKGGVMLLLEFLDQHRQLVGLLYDVARHSPELLERYQEAIDIAEMGRKACVKYGQYRTLPSTLAIMAECYHFLNNDERSKELYRQAYYLHQAIDNERGVQLVESEMQRYFGKNILFER